MVWPFTDAKEAQTKKISDIDSRLDNAAQKYNDQSRSISNLNDKIAEYKDTSKNLGLSNKDREAAISKLESQKAELTKERTATANQIANLGSTRDDLYAAKGFDPEKTLEENKNASYDSMSKSIEPLKDDYARDMTDAEKGRQEALEPLKEARAKLQADGMDTSEIDKRINETNKIYDDYEKGVKDDYDKKIEEQYAAGGLSKDEYATMKAERAAKEATQKEADASKAYNDYLKANTKIEKIHNKKETCFSDLINSIGTSHKNYYDVEFKLRASTSIGHTAAKTPTCPIIKCMLPVDWRKFNMYARTFAESINLPTLSITDKPIRFTGPEYKFANEMQFTDTAVITFYSDNDGVLIHCFNKWLGMIYNYKDKLVSFRDDYTVDMTITVHRTGFNVTDSLAYYEGSAQYAGEKAKHNNSIVAVYEFHDCFPVNIRAMDLGGDDENIATFDVTFNYRWFEILNDKVTQNMKSSIVKFDEATSYVTTDTIFTGDESHWSKLEAAASAARSAKTKAQQSLKDQQAGFFTKGVKSVGSSISNGASFVGSKISGLFK